MRTCRLILAVLLAQAAAAGAALPGWEPERPLTRGGGAAATSINFAKSIALDEAGRLHVVWVEARDGSTDVFYKRSIDAGKSWGPALPLTRAPGDAFNPSVAATGGSVHVVWQDARNGQQGVFHRRSLDAGATWQPAEPLADAAGSPSVAVQGTAVHVVFGRGIAPDNVEIFTRRSLDGGAAWEPEVRITRRPFSSWTPTIAVDGPYVYLAWTDTADVGSVSGPEEEYFSRSEDGGATFSAPLRLTVDPPDRPANSWAPSLAASGEKVWVVWFDEHSGGWEISMKRSTDAGRTWTEGRQLTSSGGSAVRPSLARRGSELWVSHWQRAPDGDDEVHLLHSPDEGETWDPSLRLTNAPGPSVLPSIAAGEYGVHVVWTDGRTGHAEVFYARLPGRNVAIGNGLVAFVRDVDGREQVFTARPDGTDERQLTVEGRNFFPSWSKDGSRLLFTSTRDAERLWVMEPDGSGQTPVTPPGPGDFLGDWSWDGTRIVFLSVRAGRQDVWLANADGSDATRLTASPEGPEASIHASWAPGDSMIWFAETRGGSTQLWGMLPDGNGPKQKTGGFGPGYPDANVPAVSRNGAIAFWSGIERHFGEVFTWDFPGGGSPVRLTETADPHNSDNPSWSPDGTRILFDSDRSGRGPSIYVMDADGSNVTELLPGAWGQSSWQPVVGDPHRRPRGGVGPGDPVRPRK